MRYLNELKSLNPQTELRLSHVRYLSLIKNCKQVLRTAFSMYTLMTQMTANIDILFTASIRISVALLTAVVTLSGFIDSSIGCEPDGLEYSKEKNVKRESE